MYIYIEAKAAYINNIHDKPIQWKTRTAYCRIIHL